MPTDFYTPLEMEDMHDTGWEPGTPTADEGEEFTPANGFGRLKLKAHRMRMGT